VVTVALLAGLLLLPHAKRQEKQGPTAGRRRGMPANLTLLLPTCRYSRRRLPPSGPIDALYWFEVIVSAIMTAGIFLP